MPLLGQEEREPVEPRARRTIGVMYGRLGAGLSIDGGAVDAIAVVRSMPYRSWDRERGCWWLPVADLTRVTAELVALGYRVERGES